MLTILLCGTLASAAEPEALPAGPQPAAAIGALDGAPQPSAALSLQQQRQQAQAALKADPDSLQALAARAAFFMRAGNEALAEGDLRAALAAAPADPALWLALAQCLLAQGLPADALASYDEALALAPRDAQLLLARGALRLKQGDGSGAENDFNLASTLSDADPSALQARIGLAYASAGRYETAANYLQRAYISSPQPGYLLDMAQAAIECGAAADAQVPLEAASTALPGSPRLALLQGRLAMLSGNPAEAAQYYRAAVAAGAGWPAQLALAQALDAASDAGAQEAWDALASNYPTEREPLLAFAWAMLERGDVMKAGLGFDSAARLAPEDEEPLRGQARILSAKGDAIQALNALWQAANLNPQPQVFLDIVELAAADPQYAADAERAQDALASRLPGHPAALRANAQRLYSDGSYSAALQACERALNAAPEDAGLLTLLADCQSRLGQYSAAAQTYQSALEQNYDPQLVAKLAGAVAQARDAEGSAAIWEQYLAAHPADAQLHELRADSLYESGQYEPALAEYQTARQLAPRDSELANQTGLCLLQLDRSAQALAEFQAALDLAPEPLYFENVAYTRGLLGDWAGAEQAYRAGLGVHPQNPALLAGLSDALAQQGRGAEAQSALLAASSQGGDTAVYIKLASLSEDNGDTAQAERAYREGLAARPGDFELLSGLALLLARTGRLDALFELTQSARASLDANEYSNLLDALSTHWLDTQASPTAAGFFERLIAADPAEPSAYCQLAIQQANLRDFPAALSSVQRGLNDAGDFYLARYLECYLTYAITGGAEALPLARSLVGHPGAEAKGWLLLLRLLQEQGFYSEQAERARLGLEANPASGEILGYLARADYFSGDPVAALEDLQQPQYEGLDFAGREALLGSCYLDLGNYPKAAAHLSTASEDPRCAPEIRAALGQCLYHMGRLGEATESLSAVLADFPGLPQALIWLGFVQVAQGQHELAAESFAQVRKSPLSGKEELAWTALGQARLALATGDSAAAQTALSESLGYGYNTDAFYAEYDEIEAQLPAQAAPGGPPAAPGPDAPRVEAGAAATSSGL